MHREEQPAQAIYSTARRDEKPRRGVSWLVRMKRFGKVDIPAEAFTVMLKRD